MRSFDAVFDLAQTLDFVRSSRTLTVENNVVLVFNDYAVLCRSARHPQLSLANELNLVH